MVPPVKHYPRLIRTAAISLVLSLFTVSFHWLQDYVPPIPEIFPHGELIIAVDASFPPFAVATADDLFGLDIDLGREIARRLGLPARFVNMGYDGLYDSLLSGQVDVVISALLIDPSRMADVNYSWAYYNAGLILVSDAARPVESMTDIPGKRLAYEFGSAADTEARAWTRRVAAFERLPYELPEHALDAVRLGQADAALVDATSGRLYLREHRDWQVVYDAVTFSPMSVAVDIDRRPVLHVVNEAVLNMLNDGTINALLDKWL